MDLGEDVNTPTTRLLTLLNVSGLKSKKRLRDEESPAPENLNKRKTVKLAEDGLDSPPLHYKINKDAEDANRTNEDDVGIQDFTAQYEQHYGQNTDLVSNASRNSLDERRWTSSREKVGRLSTVFTLRQGDTTPPLKKLAKKTAILERLSSSFEARQSKLSSGQRQLQDDLLSILSAYLDLYHPALSLDDHKSIREVIALHALNHITKKRRRVLKNNERLAHAKAASVSPPEDVQDQGFTRPSVLVLLPFRSSALAWLNAFTTHTPSPGYQIENQSRFLSEYGLPLDAIDKLAAAELGTYPRDHVETFKGNVDDNFRVGIKLTRKSVKLFADFYGCDLVLASPLGLRMSIEKEKTADFLSSIEILVIDQMNALSMQNWEHVQFVLSNMNNLPKDSHDADFSRIKPWYLDGHSAYLRQSILLSPFEMPDMRALFNNTLKNTAGKVRVEKTWPAIHVPDSIDQTFSSFDCATPKDEVDKRFAYFTTQLLPKVLKSAVQSTNTVIFIPSSFDFIRVHNYFRKQSSVSFAVLSEYSTNQDITRARQAFFSGKKAFLLVSERFYFYRRYKIRGIRNIIFYGPPEHAQFFSEFLAFPFLDDGVEAADVVSRVIYSKYDRFMLERIVGTKAMACWDADGMTWCSELPTFSSVRWRSWLSHLSNTQKVLSSSLDHILLLLLLLVDEFEFEMSTYLYELPTTGAISFGDFCADGTPSNAYASHIAEATQARANLRGVLKDTKRTDIDDKDYLRLIKVLDDYLPYLYGIMGCVVSGDIRLKSEPRFSWRTTLSANLFHSSPRINLVSLHADLASSLLTYAFALSNFARVTVANLGSFEHDRAISDIERKAKDEKLNFAVTLLCRASGIFTHISEKVLLCWDKAGEGASGRPPDVSKEVNAALAKMALADAQTLAIRKFLSKSAYDSELSPGPPLPKSHPSIPLIIKFHLECVSLYSSARTLAMTPSSARSASPPSNADSNAEVCVELLRYLANASVFYTAIAHKWLGVDAGESGVCEKGGEAVAWLLWAKKELEEMKEGGLSIAVGRDREKRGRKGRVADELDSVVVFLKHYKKINDSLTFQPVPKQQDLLARIPAGILAVHAKPYTPPAPAFGPGSVEYARSLEDDESSGDGAVSSASPRTYAGAGSYF